MEVSQDVCSEPQLVTPTPVISVRPTTPTDSPSYSTTITEAIAQKSKPDPTPIPTTDETVVNPVQDNLQLLAVLMNATCSQPNIVSTHALTPL